MERVRSPCIGVCLLDPTWKKMCVGCHRFLYEIQHWNSFSEEKKKEIVDRINQLRDEDPADYPKY